MKDYIGLITQILLLISAVIGLIVGAFEIFKKRKFNMEKQTNTIKKDSFLKETFKPMLGMLGVIGFMLIFPLFIFIFSLLMKATSFVSNINENKHNLISSISITNFTTNDIKYLNLINIADKISSSYDKDKALENIINKLLD